MLIKLKKKISNFKWQLTRVEGRWDVMTRLPMGELGKEGIGTGESVKKATAT